MKILGFHFGKDPGITTEVQLRYTNPQGPFTDAFANWRFRKVSGDFYEIMREAVPIIDAAIRRLISMNGTLKIIGTRMDIVKALEEFCLFVPVNDMQKGMHAYRQNIWNEVFEQGSGLAEYISTPDLSDIAGLKVSDSKYITYRLDKDGRSVPWYRYPLAYPSTYPGALGIGNANQVYTDPGQLMARILNPQYGMPLIINDWNEIPLNMSNKLYYSIDNENSDPYGTALMRSCEFAVTVLATLQHSMKNAADRFGDPVIHAHYAGTSKEVNTETRRKTLQEMIQTVLGAKRAGKSGDIVTAGAADSKVEIKVVGHDGQLFAYEIPVRHILEQIVSKTGLPAWMLGIYWSTTERMATLEVETVLQDAKIRQLTEIPETMRLFSTFLKLRGFKWKTTTLDPNQPGDWGFYYETPNLHDIVAQAQAEFLRSQAAMMRAGGQAPGQVVNQDAQVQIGSQATIEIGGMKFPVLRPVKSQAAPMLVRYDGKIYSLAEYVASKLPDVPPEPIPQSACTCGHKHTLDQADRVGVLHASVHKELQRPTPWPELDKIESEYEAALKYDWNELKKKVFTIAGLKIPDASSASSATSAEKSFKAFSFDDDQRKAVLDALKEYLGWYEPTDPDSPVKWSYMQSYSLGLIKAANLMSKDRPLLDILKNKEIFDQLVQTGFQYVKDGATLAIKEQIIPAMEAGVNNGSNPLDVARELDRNFWDQNASWERLARTEMNGSAQQAKYDEWNTRGVDMTGYVNGPRKLHPRCRCDNTVEQRDGKWYAVFKPAPDACPACQAAAEGTKVLMH